MIADQSAPITLCIQNMTKQRTTQNDVLGFNATYI